MHKKIILLSFLIFSQKSFASRGMDPIDPSWTMKPGTLIQITNMPKVVSQDSIGFCYAATATVLIDQATCKDRGLADCSNMGDDLRASMLDFSRFGDPKTYEPLKYGRSDFVGLYLDAGGIANPLIRALWPDGTTSFLKESCMPFDQYVLKLESPEATKAAEDKMWGTFKESYEAFQNKGCVDCADSYAEKMAKDLKAEFNMDFSLANLPLAYKEPSYEAFLEMLIIPDKCYKTTETVDIPKDLVVKYLAEPGKTSNYNEFIDAIKDKLSKKIPLGMGFCAGEDFMPGAPADCVGAGHTLVIKGFKQVCDTQNKCKDALQVQNSWGQAWQDNNSDGWLDARVLLDRTDYIEASLVWLEKGQW